MAKIQKMIERNYGNVSFAAILDKRFSLADGRYNVSIRITHKSKRVYIVTGTTMTEAEYGRSVTAKHGEWYNRRKDVERFFDVVYGYGQRMIDNGSFSFSVIKDKMHGVGGDTVSVLFGRKMDELRSERTKNVYRYALAKFIGIIGDIAIRDVDVYVVNRYIDRMRKEGVKDATIGMYARSLRAVFNLAIYLDMVSAENYPFSRSKYDRLAKIPTGSKRCDRFISVEDVMKIDRLEKNEKEMMYWSMWMFSYLCGGMNLVDMAELRYDAEYVSNGDRLVYSRKKTETTSKDVRNIIIPIIDRTAEILAEYGSNVAVNRLIFPFISRCEKDELGKVAAIRDFAKLVSKYVGRLCERCGVEKVTMTYARHSFKTNMMRAGVSERYTETAMGHVQNDVGSFYSGGFTIEQMREFHERLLNGKGGN